MSAPPPRPRFGIEEEFLVIDPESRGVAPRAGAVVARARTALGPRVSGELTHLQVETRTGICSTAQEALDQLLEARSALGAAARAEGVRVAATATPVLAGAVPPPITEGERQDRGNATFRGLHDEQAICALHVHIEVPDRDLAVKLSNRLRPYLPVLSTFTANSPFWSGADTGYASWRTMVWSRWPVAGPPPVFTSAAHYDEVVATMLDAGAMVDLGTVFWDVRPSANNPTLEIRVADVPITAQESVLFAAVVRALVARAAQEVARGEPDPLVAPELMRLAYWRAARDGLDGEGFDFATGRLVPARVLVERLVEALGPQLRAHGDHDLISRWLDGLLSGGSGARRQREAYRAAGRLEDVVDHLIAHTSGG